MNTTQPHTLAYTQRYEKAEQYLTTLLDAVASPFHNGGERKSAKIGMMKAIIHQWAARNADCLESLEYHANLHK